MSEINAVETLLTLRDEATAGLLRFGRQLRTMQRQIDETTASLRAMLAATDGMALAQSRVLELTAREGAVRSDITAEIRAQGEALTAARTRSLDLSREELATQREILAASRESNLGGGAGGHGPGGTGAALHSASSTSFWTGAGLLGVGVTATEMAARYQQTTLEAELALGGVSRSVAQRTRDMQKMQDAAKAASEATGFFDQGQIMEGFKVAASSGGRGLVAQMGMDKFISIMPALAQYMDVLGRIKNEPADRAAADAIQAAHMMQAYTPEQIRKSLNAQAAMALLTSDSTKQTITVGGYVIPQGLNLEGMNSSALLGLIATASQQGIGHGRAGGRLRSFLQTLSSPQTPSREKARHELGLGNAIDSSGKLNIDTAMSDLLRDSQTMGLQRYRDAVTRLFGASGAPVAAMFSHPTAQLLYLHNRDAIDSAIDNGDLSTIQSTMRTTPLGMQQSTWAQVKNNMIDFGQHGLPIMAAFFKEALKDLKAVDAWMSAHKSQSASIIKWVLGIGGALVGLSVLGSVAGSIIKLHAAFMLFRNAGIVVSGLRALGGAWSFLGTVATQQAVRIPSILTAIGRGIASLASFLAIPAVAGMLATLGLTLTVGRKTANANETLPYDGHDAKYWQDFIKARHGATAAIPKSVLDQLKRAHQVPEFRAKMHRVVEQPDQHWTIQRLEIKTDKPITREGAREFDLELPRHLAKRTGLRGASQSTSHYTSIGAAAFGT